MDNEEISIASHHTRNRSINGKKVQIDYEEIVQPDGRALIRYKTYMDDKPLPLEFAISKEIMQTLHKNHDQGIYSDIPDSILEWIQDLDAKTVARPIIQNWKPVSSCRVLEQV
jgi:hypothetical protein